MTETATTPEELHAKAMIAEGSASKARSEIERRALLEKAIDFEIKAAQLLADLKNPRRGVFYYCAAIFAMQINDIVTAKTLVGDGLKGENSAAITRELRAMWKSLTGEVLTDPPAEAPAEEPIPTTPKKRKKK